VVPTDVTKPENVGSAIGAFKSKAVLTAVLLGATVVDAVRLSATLASA